MKAKEAVATALALAVTAPTDALAEEVIGLAQDIMDKFLLSEADLDWAESRALELIKEGVYG